MLEFDQQFINVTEKFAGPMGLLFLSVKIVKSFVFLFNLFECFYGLEINFFRGILLCFGILITLTSHSNMSEELLC